VEIKGDAKSYDKTTTIISARYMTKYPKSKIVKFSILIIFEIRIVSILENTPTIEKPMTVCFDISFCDMSIYLIFFWSFSDRRLHIAMGKFQKFFSITHIL
jgi:hypothetical protein